MGANGSRPLLGRWSDVARGRTGDGNTKGSIERPLGSGKGPTEEEAPGQRKAQAKGGEGTKKGDGKGKGDCGDAGGKGDLGGTKGQEGRRWIRPG